VGLLHAYSGTCSIDIDGWDTAVIKLAEQGIDLAELYNDPTAVKIHSGNPGHAKLIYRLDAPMLSKKLIEKRVVNNVAEKFNYIDFRCATVDDKSIQDLLPPTIHPTTRVPYTWEGDWKNLPLIPDILRNYWQSLINNDAVITVRSDNKPLCSLQDVESALYSIDPSIDRDSWVHIGMALHDAGTQTDQVDQMHILWDEWSRESEKYNTKDLNNAWRSFDSTKANVKTIGTLFHYAKEQGWKPEINVEGLFTRVNNDPTSEMANMDIFSTNQVPPPIMDVDLLPEILKIRAQEVSTSVGCDCVVPVLAGLSAVCAVVDARSRLTLLEGFKVPPVLWIATVGEPSDKKSPGSRPMFKELTAIEVDDRPNQQKRMLEWEGVEAKHKTDHINYIDTMSNIEHQLGNVLPPLVTDLPHKPQPLRYIVEDVTSQKLIHVCEHRPQGMMLLLDEMNHWITRLGDVRSGENRGTWIAGYEASHYRMDRITTGEKILDHFALNIYGNVQPPVLAKALESLSEDGMMQRFLFGVLRPTHTRKPKPIPPMLSHEAQWNRMLRGIASMPPMAYKLSPSAQKVFDRFQDWYLDYINKERLYRSSRLITSALGKSEGTVGRLALVMHMIESPWNIEVSGELMANACDLYADYFMSSLKYVVNELTPDKTNSIEAWVRRHILVASGLNDKLTTSDIISSSRRLWDKHTKPHEKTQIINSLLSGMELSGWVQMIALESDSRRSHWVWAINPKPSQVYAEQRVRIIAEQQEVLDNLRETSGGRIPRRFAKGYEADNAG